MILLEVFLQRGILKKLEYVYVFNKTTINFQEMEKAGEKYCCIKSRKEDSAIGIGYVRVTRDRIVPLV